MTEGSRLAFVGLHWWLFPDS